MPHSHNFETRCIVCFIWNLEDIKDIFRVYIVIKGKKCIVIAVKRSDTKHNLLNRFD